MLTPLARFNSNLFGDELMALPILMYHQLAVQMTANCYTLCVTDFEAQLRDLMAQGLRVATVDDLFVNGQWSPGSATVAITFDDGHASDFELALPILQKFGCRATFFVTTDWIDSPGYLGREQIRKLRAAGMSIQSHAKSHSFLDALSGDELQRELSWSKEELGKIVGHPVNFLSCPGGRYNRDVLRAARKVGYRAVFTSCPYWLHQGAETLVIGRSVMRYRESGCEFNRLVRPNKVEVLQQQAAYLGKFIVKKILGDKRYHRLWQKIVKKRQ